MLGNKICVTEKGLDFLSEGLSQFKVHENHIHTRTSSLPVIKNLESFKRQTISQQLVKNEKLSELATKLQKIEKIGLRQLKIRNEDKILAGLLQKQMKYKQKYLQSLIPNIVKKTRDPNKTDNIDSRYNRSRAYTQRLLQNYQSQKHFGAQNNVKRDKKNNEQEQDNRNNKL